ncbi:ABC transporter permease subunit [Radiobacillus deserti]|uniref:ABC transporter permease subunit n=1 Tax=Radiobacillus deserti TaxID=2594883 RepID=A0A516KHX1_9BACI|nr:ABC transporter permease subunit [Radiobacillus deserti]QDP40981.1 ABC transporter permease subunit [Radiobacillus deserti]
MNQKWMYVINELSKPLLLIVGIFVVSISPLFMSANGLIWPGKQVLTNVIEKMFQPGALVYTNPVSGIERDLFPYIFKAFFSSASVLGIAFAVSFSIALLTATLLWYAPTKMKELCLSFSSLLQSIPDVMYVVISQLLLIWFYQETGTRLANISGAGTDEAILLPALILSILPTIFFFQSMLRLMDEEKKEPYFDLALSKGLTRFWILLKHILRNMLIRLAYQSKYLISLMISNLLIIEYMFENLGMTSLLFSYSQPPVFFVTGILFFVPIYLLLKFMELVLYRLTNQEVSL